MCTPTTETPLPRCPKGKVTALLQSWLEIKTASERPQEKRAAEKTNVTEVPKQFPLTGDQKLTLSQMELKSSYLGCAWERGEK